MVEECNYLKSSRLILRMACGLTAQLKRTVAMDDKSQNLHGSGSITCVNVFKHEYLINTLYC